MFISMILFEHDSNSIADYSKSSKVCFCFDNTDKIIRTSLTPLILITFLCANVRLVFDWARLIETLTNRTEEKYFSMSSTAHSVKFDKNEN